MHRTIIAQGGIAAEQNRQDMLRIAAEMRLASQIAPVTRHPATSYLWLAKVASLNPFRARRKQVAIQRRLESIVNA